MSNATNYQEPRNITNWRVAYKKTHGGLDLFRNIYKNANKPLDYKSLEKYVELQISKGNISKEVAEQVLKYSKEKDWTVEEVPEYESFSDYLFLKGLSDKIEPAISREIKLGDEQEAFALEHSPCIITGRLGGLNAESGRIDPDSNDNHYIAFDAQFVNFIRRIGEIGTRLFDVKDENDLMERKNICEINIRRDPDIYRYFRDVFYHFMFYDNKNIKDENIRKLFAQEFLINHAGFLPPPGINDKLFFSIGDVITESMGLFIMAHEYIHIIFHDLFNYSFDCNNDIAESYQKEFQADDLALLLVWDCMLHQYNQTVHEKAKARFCFIGIEIILNCLNIIAHMRSVMNGNEKTIVSATHPPIKRRMENVRQSMFPLWNISSEEVELLDAVDVIFQKLGDHVIDELTKNEDIIAFCQSKKQRIAILKSELSELVKEKQTENITTEDIDTKIVSLCESILEEDSNNITALFVLGSLYYENEQDVEAIEYFTKILSIAGEDIIENRPFDMRMYQALYHLGDLYMQQIISILQDSNLNPSTKQEEEIKRLSDKTEAMLLAAVHHYHHDGMAFFYLGSIYSSIKNDHEKAVEYFDKALQYQPDNPKILFARQASAEKLTGMPDPHSFKLDIADVINLAENGDAQAQYLLGYYYLEGKGVKQDLNAAVGLLTKAAKQGEVNAQSILGNLYMNGVGVAVNFDEAFHWYHEAAKQGDADAQYELAGLLYKTGGDRNRIGAIAWLREAAKQGHSGAKKTLEKIGM